MNENGAENLLFFSYVFQRVHNLCRICDVGILRGEGVQRYEIIRLGVSTRGKEANPTIEGCPVCGISSTTPHAKQGPERSWFVEYDPGSALGQCAAGLVRIDHGPLAEAVTNVGNTRGISTTQGAPEKVEATNSQIQPSRSVSSWIQLICLYILGNKCLWCPRVTG